MTTVAEQLVSQVSERLSGIKVVYTDLDGTMLGRNGSFLHDPDGKATLQPEGPVETVRETDRYIVTFVHVNPPGVRGPDFDARVTLDASTGDVIQILGAS